MKIIAVMKIVATTQLVVQTMVVFVCLYVCMFVCLYVCLGIYIYYMDIKNIKKFIIFCTGL